MRFFFRSPQFIKAVIITCVIVALAVVSALLGGHMSPESGLLGAIAAPFQKLAAAVSDSYESIKENFTSAEELNAEKKELQDEINTLKEQLVDYQEAINENKFYEDYLEIKDLNPDFKFCAASVVGRDPDDVFAGFTVDAGALHGIELYDPVITDAGLVGYVTQVGATTSKVTTVLSPKLTAGAYGSRTGDAGALSGTTDLAAQGKTRFFNLPRTCSIAIGDLVVTSGSGIFPKGIIIGSIESIENDPLSSSLIAQVSPAVDFGEMRDVMILTSFAGQGSELTEGE